MTEQLQKLQKGRESRSILIIDDDEALAQSLSRVLKPFFQNCVIANDGQEGLALFLDYLQRNNPFTIVMTDLELPKKGGLSLIKEIRSLEANQPIIILSAHDGAELMSEAIALEVQAYLLKPLSMPKLFATLEKIFYKTNPELEKVHIDPITGYKVVIDFESYLDALTTDTTIVMKIKINHLVNIYNLIGEEFTNKYLHELCSSLQNLCADLDATFYKISKDELAFVLQDVEIDFAKTLANDMSLVAKYFHLFENGIIINSTISVSITQGKSDFTVSNAQSVMKMIYNAIEKNEIIPYIQPAFELRSNKIEFFNSYIRIKENETIFEPKNFLHVAQNAHQLSIITRAMIKNSFALKHAIQPQDALLVIYLCDEDIYDMSLLQYTLFWAERYDIDPATIGFEIAACALSFEYKFSLISELKERGFKIMIRQVGIEKFDLYSFIDIKPHYIKLHPTLFSIASQDTHTMENLKKMIEIMHIIGTKIVATKIQEKQELNLAKSLEIDIIQGYELAHPHKVREDESR